MLNVAVLHRPCGILLLMADLQCLQCIAIEPLQSLVKDDDHMKLIIYSLAYLAACDRLHKLVKLVVHSMHALQLLVTGRVFVDVVVL